MLNVHMGKERSFVDIIVSHKYIMDPSILFPTRILLGRRRCHKIEHQCLDGVTSFVGYLICSGQLVNSKPELKLIFFFLKISVTNTAKNASFDKRSFFIEISRPNSCFFSFDGKYHNS